jgi:hypothetical protein
MERLIMFVLAVICLIIVATFVIVWLYRKISLGKKYVKTVGEIIDVKNMIPLVEKSQVEIGGNYAYTECKFQGDVYVAVKFISRDGQELVRRYNSSEPLLLKINEHEHSVPQYTAIFPDWEIGKRIKIFYDPQNTLDIFIAKVLRGRATINR